MAETILQFVAGGLALTVMIWFGEAIRGQASYCSECMQKGINKQPVRLLPPLLPPDTHADAVGTFRWGRTKLTSCNVVFNGQEMACLWS